MTSSLPDYYEALGLGPRATPEEIEKARKFFESLYAEGALATYSLLDEREAREARERIQAAYQTLSDPEKRHAYDVAHGLASEGQGLLRFERARPDQLEEGSSAALAPETAAVPQLNPGEAPAAPSASSAAPVQGPPSSAAGAPAHGHVAPSGSTGHAHPADRPGPFRLPEPVSGATLRRFREERGVSLRDISTRTKIGVRFLEYIESDRHSDLPALVYLKGFLTEYAKTVGLDPRPTVESYLTRVKASDR